MGCSFDVGEVTDIREFSTKIEKMYQNKNVNQTKVDQNSMKTRTTLSQKLDEMTIVYSLKFDQNSGLK